MSASDSDMAAACSVKVSDAKLVAALRDAVQQGGDDEQLTVNSVRAQVEKKFGLKPGFFKDAKWKARSGRIIRGEEETEAEAEKPPHDARIDKAAGKKRKAPAPDKTAKKRDAKSKKRRDSEESDLSSLSDDAESDVESQRKGSSNKNTQAAASAARDDGSESPLSDAESDELQSPQNPASKNKGGGGEASENELSELIDDEPSPPKKRTKTEPERKTKGKATKKGTAPKADAAPSDPDKEEIKKLQGWLVRCGIRKLWGKELAPFEGSKAKIRHLKQLLSDAGMTGRYSLEKARQIKESRELAADLEAVQEGNKIWGMEADGEGGEGSAPEERPKRRLAKGLQELAFLSSGGEGDSD